MFECGQSENEKLRRLKYTKGGAVDVKENVKFAEKDRRPETTFLTP